MNRRRKRARARQVLAGAGLMFGSALLVVAAQLAMSADGGPNSVPGSVPLTSAEPHLTGLPSPSAAADPRPAPPARGSAPLASPPTLMTIIGQDVPLKPVGLRSDGSMDLPDTPHAGGWWAPGSAPSDPSGTVVVAGHVDTAEEGPGIFAELASLEEGTPVAVTTADGRSTTYTVTTVSSYVRERLPAELFTPRGARRLAIVTCTGPFDADAGTYTRNLVVLAEPAL